MPTQLWTAIHQGVLADRPAASSTLKGYVFFATDVHGGTLYQCDGSTWVQIAAALDGSSYTLPVATSSTRGGIKPGRGLVVTADGTLLPHDLSAEQIASVAASVVRGTHGLADAVLSTNVPLLDAANTFTRNQVINSPGSGNPLDVKVSSTSVVTVDNLGDLTLVGGTLYTTGGYIQYAGASHTTNMLCGPTKITIFTSDAANRGLVVAGAPSQSANLQEWQDNSGTVLSSISASGDLALPSKTQHTVLAAPSGSSGVPSFRALEAGDLPVATTGAAGAVKAGRGLVVSSDGTLRPQDVAADQIASVAPSVVTGRWEPVGHTDGTMLTDGDGAPVMALVGLS